MWNKILFVREASVNFKTFFIRFRLFGDETVQDETCEKRKAKWRKRKIVLMTVLIVYISRGGSKVMRALNAH